MCKDRERSALCDEQLERVSGGNASGDFAFLKSKCIYAISQLRRDIRDYINTNPRHCNVAALNSAIDALELVEDDVHNANEQNQFLFCDNHWGTVRAYIRASRVEEFFTNANFILIEQIIVND